MCPNEKKQLQHKAFVDTHDFATKYRYTREWTPEMNKEYRKAMTSVLRNWFGIHGGTTDILNDMCYGNWERLHETNEEKHKTIPDLVQDLVGEMFYCSDRWSWDRFMRTHWIYQRIMWRQKYGEYRFVEGVAI